MSLWANLLEDGREIDRELVPREFWLKPLSFKPLGDAHFGVDVYTAGFHGDIEGGPHKNCEQNRLFRHRNGQNDLLAFNGDVMEMASGSAISVKGKGDELSLAAVLIGQISPEGSSDYEGEFDVKTRFNYAVNADIFYDDFMAYRRSIAFPKSI